MFFGESMFARESNASKGAFVALVRWLKARGFGPLDCQIQNDHLASLGAKTIPRQEFMNLLDKHLAAGDTIRGPWSLDLPTPLP
jgi:leucyl/phenylalanyl-tRNA--protein transferase